MIRAFLRRPAPDWTLGQTVASLVLAVAVGAALVLAWRGWAG